MVWGVMCGAAASGNFHWTDPSDIAKSLTCMVLSGPCLTGFTQVGKKIKERGGEVDTAHIHGGLI